MFPVLGIIKPEKLYVLDDITKHLLTQTSSAILKDMSKEKIHEEFIQQVGKERERFPD